jgi:hypothetical protein
MQLNNYRFILTRVRIDEGSEPVFYCSPAHQAGNGNQDFDTWKGMIRAREGARVGDIVTFSAESLDDLIIRESIGRCLHVPKGAGLIQALTPGQEVYLTMADGSSLNLKGIGYSRKNIRDAYSSCIRLDGEKISCAIIVKHTNYEALDDSLGPSAILTGVTAPRNSLSYFLVAEPKNQRFSLTGDEFYSLYLPFREASVTPNMFIAGDEKVTVDFLKFYKRGLDDVKAFIILDSAKNDFQARTIGLIEGKDNRVLKRDAGRSDISKALTLYRTEAHKMYGKEHPLVIVNNIGDNWDYPDSLGFPMIHLRPQYF